MQVIDAIEFILPLVFLSEIGDGLNGVCGGKPYLFVPTLNRSIYTAQ